MSNSVITTLRNQINPESARIATQKCTTIFVDRHPVPRPPIVYPFDVVPVPASVTTANRRETTLQLANDPTNPDTRFLAFFPPQPPPPQFLQVPPTRVNYEPIARTSGCRQRTWDTS